MAPPAGAASVHAVVLDLDDTLLDHRGSTAQAVAAWLPMVRARAAPLLLQTWFDLEDRHFDSWRTA